MTTADQSEQFAADQLARVLDSAAATLADTAEEIRRLAERARQGDVRAGYAHLAARAHTVAVAALPNMGLPQAFEMAALADRFRTTD